MMLNVFLNLTLKLVQVDLLVGWPVRCCFLISSIRLMTCMTVQRQRKHHCLECWALAAHLYVVRLVR